MTILRDLRATTRLLFLQEITSNRHTRLRTIADRLDITVQGTSDYAHDLQSRGFLTLSDGQYRATKKGIAFLLDGLRELRSFVETAGRSLASVETTAAFAGSPLRRGDRVGLFMEGGRLVAYPSRSSPSTGITMRDAEKGGDVPVRDLEGIVSLHPGRVVVARVPPIRDGGTQAIDREKSRKMLRKAEGHLVAGLDVTGVSAARAFGFRTRIEFGVLPAVIEAAEGGVDVLLFVPEERAAETVAAIEAANGELEEKIPYESVALQ